MAKQIWKPGNMLYPLPAVMVSVADKEGNPNIITVAWAGTVCTNPPMVSISVRPSRYSYDIIEKTGEFVINLTPEKLALLNQLWEELKSDIDISTGIYVICGVIIAVMAGFGVCFAVRRKIRNIY